MSLFTTVDTWK